MKFLLLFIVLGITFYCSGMQPVPATDNYFNDKHNKGKFNTLNCMYSSSFNLYNKEDKPHSPHKASVLSAIFPGAGQIYNRKYWKAPVVWAGMGIFIYAFTYNKTQTKIFQTELNARKNNDSASFNPQFESIPTEFLRNERNTFRGNRDLSLIGLLAFYGLNIVDAAVDAHLYKFDVDKSLSFKAKPEAYITNSGFSPGLNMGLTLSF